MSRIHQLSKKNAFKARVSTFRELLEIEQSWPVHGWASPNTPRYDVMRSIFCHQHIFAGATEVDSWVALKNLFLLGICGLNVAHHDLLPYYHTKNSPPSDAEYGSVLFFLQELQHSQDATQLMIGWFFPGMMRSKEEFQKHQVIVWSSRDAGEIVVLHTFVAIHTVWNDPWSSILPSPFT